MSVGPRKSASSVLRRPSVRRWVLARLLSGIAMTSLRATVLWQVYDLTQSLALLGLVGLLSFLPAPIAALTGGVVADAYDRKRVVLIAQGWSSCVRSASPRCRRPRGPRSRRCLASSS
ncbi:MAG: MFS transporter [Polyangiaceae bacterium]|nr:MFS transporter [Polyangiaceae bacterium]